MSFLCVCLASSYTFAKKMYRYERTPPKNNTSPANNHNPQKSLHKYAFDILIYMYMYMYIVALRSVVDENTPRRLTPATSGVYWVMMRNGEITNQIKAVTHTRFPRGTSL